MLRERKRRYQFVTETETETEATIAAAARRSSAEARVPSQIITVSAAGSGRAGTGARLCPTRRQMSSAPQA
jgi:hypothetical protein